MSVNINNCGGHLVDEKEVLNTLLVYNTATEQYGLRAQVSNVASSNIVSGAVCGGANIPIDQILRMILNNSTIDGRVAIQFFNVTS